MSTTKTTAEIIRRPLMSGHCGGHSERATLSDAQAESHAHCVRNGGGNRANPLKEFQPCPCPHHYRLDANGEPAEVYECGGCGREIVEAWYWPLDEDGETRFTHIDGTGRATGENCEDDSRNKRSAADEPPPEKDCSRCGKTFRGTGRGRLCPSCVAADEAEAEVEDDFDDLADFDDVLDEFADLDDLDED